MSRTEQLQGHRVHVYTDSRPAGVDIVRSVCTFRTLSAESTPRRVKVIAGPKAPLQRRRQPCVRDI